MIFEISTQSGTNAEIIGAERAAVLTVPAALVSLAGR
jgi:hypothetical protein